MAKFSIRLAGVEDKREIYDLTVQSFLPDMPLFQGFGVTTPFDIDEWPSLQTIGDNLTLLAVFEGKEIMGFAINVVPKDGVAVGIPGPLGSFFEFIEEDSKGLLSKLERSTMELRVMCINGQWRRLGLAKKLLEESEFLARKHGYKSIFGMATGAYMENAFKRQGWTCVYRLYYKDYAKVNSNFKLPPEPHTSLTLYEKVF